MMCGKVNCRTSRKPYTGNKLKAFQIYQICLFECWTMEKITSQHFNWVSLHCSLGARIAGCKRYSTNTFNCYLYLRMLHAFNILYAPTSQLFKRRLAIWASIKYLLDHPTATLFLALHDSPNAQSPALGAFISYQTHLNLALSPILSHFDNFAPRLGRL
jgi:hypothetical protein